MVNSNLPFLVLVSIINFVSILPIISTTSIIQSLCQLRLSHFKLQPQRCYSTSGLRHQQAISCSLSAKFSLTITSQQNHARRNRFFCRQFERDQTRGQTINMEDTGATAGTAGAAPPTDPNLAALLASANTNNVQLNATLQALLNHFATPSVPVHDLFASSQPFNLAHRSGLTAY